MTHTAGGAAYRCTGTPLIPGWLLPKTIVWVTKRIEQSMRRVADNEMYQDSLTGQVNTAKGWRKQSLNVAEGDRFTPVVENNRKRPGFNPAHGAYRPTR